MTQNYGCNQQLADLLPTPAETTVILLWGYLSKIPSKKNCCSRSSYFKDFLTRNLLGAQKKWYTKWDEFEFQRYRNQSEKLNRPFLLASKRFRAENAGGIFWPGMFGTLKQMLQEWWNEGVDNSAQKFLHMDDLLMMADPAYSQNRTIKWMILGEEVWCLCWEVARNKIWSPAPMYQKV